MRNPFREIASGSGLVVLFLAFCLPLRAQTVSGKFLGNGEDGKIQYVLVQPREPFSDKAAVRLIFTAKNPAASKKPDFDAGFKKLGSALVLSVFKDGGVFGCEVVHEALPKSPFSAIGKIKVQDIEVTETNISGHVTTGGEQEAFGQKWDVDLKFSAPLPAGAFAEVPAPSATPIAKEEEPAAAGPKVAVSTLPLPAAASEVEYKAAVQQIGFKSPAPPATVAEEMSKSLKQQGWKEGAGSLVTKTNAILKREKNGAELTIMIQPAGAGSSVKILTKGLDWSDTPESAPAPVQKDPATGSIEDEANRLLNDALKKLPGGL